MKEPLEYVDFHVSTVILGIQYIRHLNSYQSVILDVVNLPVPRYETIYALMTVKCLCCSTLRRRPIPQPLPRFVHIRPLSFRSSNTPL